MVISPISRCPFCGVDLFHDDIYTTIVRVGDNVVQVCNNCMNSKWFYAVRKCSVCGHRLDNPFFDNDSHLICKRCYYNKTKNKK